MSTPTLDRHDRTVLARLADGPASVGTLADAVDRPRADLRRRLDALVAGGLVRRRGDGTYARTESGRRVVAASATGRDDERIDTPAGVESTLHSLDLRPDEADAVRSAFAFLRFRGSASAAEIVDATFAEAPAGRDDPQAWWRECVRDRLAALPDVEPPDGAGTWRYVGPGGGDAERADGRLVFGRGDAETDADHADPASARVAAERRAVDAALAILCERGQATEATLRQHVGSDAPSGEDGAAGWSDRVRNGLAAVPGVTRADDRTWRYRPPPGP